MTTKLGVHEKPAFYNAVRTVRLGDVAQSMKNGIYKSKDAYADDGVACLRMYNIGDGRIIWRDIKRMSLSEQERSEYGLEPGDLLVNRVNSRELVGKTALVTAGIERSVFESKNIRVRLDRSLVEPAYVNYALLALGRTHFNRNAQQVVGMASVSQPQVAAFQFLLRPVAQQREVVAYLDEQLSRLDASVAALHRVQANLKRYRASVLKSACEGRLVPTEAELARQEGRTFETGAQLLQRILVERHARLGGKGKYKGPAALTASKKPELPIGWTWATVEQLTFLVTSGSRGWSAFYADAGTLFIRAQDIKTDALNVDGVARVNVPGDAEGSRSSVGSSDIVITITGANVTKSALVPALSEAAFVSQHVALLKLTLEDTAAFVFNWIVSPANGRKTLESWAYGAGKPGLSLEQVRELHVALPPLAEQHRIVAEADRRLSLIRVAEAQVTANLTRAQRLRQSILQAAFSG